MNNLRINNHINNPIYNFFASFVSKFRTAVHLPEQRSDRRQTSAKRVSGDSQFFIFRRWKICWNLLSNKKHETINENERVKKIKSRSHAVKYFDVKQKTRRRKCGVVVDGMLMIDWWQLYLERNSKQKLFLRLVFGCSSSKTAPNQQHKKSKWGGNSFRNYKSCFRCFL